MEYFKVNDNLYYLPLERLIVNLDSFSKELNLDTLFNKLKSNKRVPQNKGKYFKMDKIFPTTVGLLLTNKCQLKCSYCYYESGSGDNTTLNKEQINVIIQYIVRNAKMKSLVFKKQFSSLLILTGGGEPTADFNIFKYCVNTYKKVCNKYNIEGKIHLVTNGFLDEKKINFIINKIDSLNISFDVLPHLQDKQRPLSNGKGSFSIIN